MKTNEYAKALETNRNLSPVAVELRLKAAAEVERLMGVQPDDTVEALRAELRKLTKEQLVERVVALTKPKTEGVTRKQVAHALFSMEELRYPDGKWMGYDEIASVMRAIMGGETSYESLASTMRDLRKEGNLYPRHKS